MQDAARVPEGGTPAGGAEPPSTPPRPIVLAPTSTESFWLVRLYRMLLPRGLRAQIARRVSPERRNRFILRAASGGPLRRALDRLAGLRFRLSHPRLLAAPHRGLARESGRIRVAEVRPVVTPLTTRRETLDLVCASLEAAGVPYFLVRPLDDRESAVAVAAADRAPALRALAAACAEAGAYADPGDAAGGGRLGARPWRHAAAAELIRIVRYFVTPDGRLVLGAEYGCVVEFWERDGDDLVAPRPNRVAARLPADGGIVRAPEERFTRLAPYGERRGRYRTREEMTVRLVDDITFPIDVVYTWVDGDDAVWRARREARRGGDRATGAGRA
jgi:hypothetical protein